MDVQSAKDMVSDQGVFSEDQIALLHDMIDALAAHRPPGSHKNIPMMTFLRRWINEPMPEHILSAGCEIMAADEYAPEKRVHRIVQTCAILWLEDAA